jgi:tetratricopeptide (TPR) repeat protein
LETRLVQCRSCGAELDPITNQCPYCPPGASPSATAPAEPPQGPKTEARGPVAALEPDRAFGLLLFEAEECLARGDADKAAKLASRAVKEHPESLTARALLDRARRGLLKGRRKEKLEAKLKEADALFEAGHLEAAGRIVTSALKLVPDHPVALALFASLKQLRLAAGSAAADAERELERLTRAHARRALEAAQAALAAGWDRKALLALLRGLRTAPDDPELLGLLRRLQGASERDDAQRARRRAANAQIRDGLDLLARGQLDESLKILRAVLLEDPDNERAQGAVEEVRRHWLAGAPALAVPVPLLAPLSPVEKRIAPEPERPALRPIATARPPIARPAPAPRAPTPAPAPVDRTAPKVPLEILLPRTRRRATPMGLILGGAVLLVIGFVFVSREGPVPGSTGRPPVSASPTAPPPTTSAREPGPLDVLEPDLRAAVEAVLAGYARALETSDASLLASARPDLSAEARAERLLPFQGALNAATDLRVVDVAQKGGLFEVTLLRTDVIVGGRSSGPSAPIEEILRFERRGGQWRVR